MEHGAGSPGGFGRLWSAMLVNLFRLLAQPFGVAPARFILRLNISKARGADCLPIDTRWAHGNGVRLRVLGGAGRDCRNQRVLAPTHYIPVAHWSAGSAMYTQ
jgi:hypothetical protein